MICGKINSIAEYADVLRKKYIPCKSLLFVPQDEPAAAIFKIANFAKDYKMLDGKTTVYICRNHICGKPVTDIEEVLAALGS